MGVWQIDASVAGDLAAVLGWDPGDGAVALASALGAAVPSGSTAKREAVAAGRTPPGAEPEVIARRVLSDRAAGRPEVAWSCWGLSTLMASLLDTLADARPAVAAIRRIDDGAPPVDVHSFVVVDELLCDPYFVSVVGGHGAAETERTVGGVWCRRTDEPDGRWSLEVGNGRFSRILAYRLLAPVLDPGDVAALCAVSATHSGAPTRPFGFLWRAEDCVEAFTHGAGGTATRTWRWSTTDIWDGTLDQAEHPDWDAAGADFAARTGIPLA